MSEEFFKGFSVRELLDLWEQLQSPEGISPDEPKDKLKALDEYLEQKKYEDSVFAVEHPLKKPLF